MDHDFGFSPTETDPYIEKLIRRAAPLDPITSNLVLIGLYHEHFGICNHNDPLAPPMPELAYHELEDTMAGNLLFELPKMYKDKAIHKHFNISLMEFMDLPMFYIDHLCELADQYSKREYEIAQQIASKEQETKILQVSQRGRRH